MIREACVGSYSEALEAYKKGVERIELCENLYEGGTTPSYGTIKKCVEDLKIPTLVMIRPRGGNFVYSNEEIEIMKSDILVCKDLGVKGVVFGILTKDGKIDLNANQELIELAKPLEVTFHKAIDEIDDPISVIDDLISIGVKRILTSGGKETALEGENVLNKMIEKADGKIKIVVAGKVTKDSLDSLSKKIFSDEFHGKKII